MSFFFYIRQKIRQLNVNVESTLIRKGFKRKTFEETLSDTVVIRRMKKKVFLLMLKMNTILVFQNLQAVHSRKLRKLLQTPLYVDLD